MSTTPYRGWKFPCLSQISPYVSSVKSGMSMGISNACTKCWHLALPTCGLFTLRKRRLLLRINGERGFLRLNRLYENQQYASQSSPMLHLHFTLHQQCKIWNQHEKFRTRWNSLNHKWLILVPYWAFASNGKKASCATTILDICIKPTNCNHHHLHIFETIFSLLYIPYSFK